MFHLFGALITVREITIFQRNVSHKTYIVCWKVSHSIDLIFHSINLIFHSLQMVTHPFLDQSNDCWSNFGQEIDSTARQATIVCCQCQLEMCENGEKIRVERTKIVDNSTMVPCGSIFGVKIEGLFLVLPLLLRVHQFRDNFHKSPFLHIFPKYVWKKCNLISQRCDERDNSFS